MRDNRVQALTGVRFLAALGVLLFHIGVLYPDATVRRLTSLGHLGVPFFFVLSGFVLTWGSSADVGLGRFWWNRFARVWPLHVATCAWAAVLALSLGHRIPRVAGLENVLLLHAWDPRVAINLGYNPVSWSLSCEATFYLAFPALLPLVRKASPGRTAMLAFGAQLTAAVLLTQAVGGVSGRHWAQFAPLPVQGLSFVVGIAAALAIEAGWQPPRLTRTVPASALLLPMAAWLIPGPEVLQRPLLDVLATVAAALVIARLTRRTLEGAPGRLAVPWLVRLGEWSYALYLVHLLLMYTARAMGLTSEGWGIVTGAAAVPVAGMCFVLLERPAERALRARWRAWQTTPT